MTWSPVAAVPEWQQAIWIADDGPTYGRWAPQVTSPEASTEALPGLPSLRQLPKTSQ